MLEILALPFMQRAVLAIVLLAILSAIFGVFIVIRKMAFFADAIAHASLAGIAIGVVLGISPTYTAPIAAILIAIGIGYISRHGKQALDTAIGIFYSLALAIGVIILAYTATYRVSLSTFLFGDILSVDSVVLAIMLLTLVATLLVLWKKNKQFLLMSLEPETALAQKIPVQANEYLFLALLALIVAMGIKIAGIIMIGPLLIIPAATAKNTALSLKQMFIYSGLFAFLAGLLGLALSYTFNLPSGPTIVVTAGVFYFVSQFGKK
ncbi:MAG: metal ABC transporter permease [bacterium]